MWPCLRRNRSGQTLVELSVALIGVVALIAAMVQIICFGLNQVHLQRMVEVAALRVGPGSTGTSRPYHWLTRPLWGRRTPTWFRREAPLRIQEWKPYRGLFTRQGVAASMKIQVTTTLLPSQLRNFRLTAGQQADLDVLIEPAAPRGRV